MPCFLVSRCKHLGRGRRSKSDFLHAPCLPHHLPSSPHNSPQFRAYHPFFLSLSLFPATLLDLLSNLRILWTTQEHLSNMGFHSYGRLNPSIQLCFPTTQRLYLMSIKVISRNEGRRREQDRRQQHTVW